MTDRANEAETGRVATGTLDPGSAPSDLIFPVVLALIAVTAWCPSLVLADGPAFDRPGIAFAPTVLPGHSFAWEQGLPDFERDRTDGVTQRAYAASTRLRYAVSDRWELQLAAPMYEELDTDGSGRSFTAAGAGDLSLAVKLGLTSGEARLSSAVLGVVSFPTAQSELSQGTEQYSLGTTVGWALSDKQSLAFYANVDLLGGLASWTVSPNWSFALGNTVGAYVEAGYQFAAHGEPPNELAGGGVTWMVNPTVQLDLYALTGLTRRSTDLAMGCGISVFIP